MKKIFPTLLVCVFAVMLILKPEISKNAIAYSIVLCGKVLIPALFPFSVCVLFIMKSGVTEKLDFLSPVTLKLFGLSASCFTLFVLSMLGGYPIGAKLLDQAVSSKKLSQSKAQKMLGFCINAGPAFIVAAVGNGIFGSKKLGYILLFSHILSSFIICIFYHFIGENFNFSKNLHIKNISPADNFVLSAGESASVTLNICSFVILFSVITAYIENFSQLFKPFKLLLYLSEITLGVGKTNNIYLISFLLGFGGFCVWCQILSVGKSIKPNILSFAIFRIIHGLLSVCITAIILKITGFTMPTFSNNKAFGFTATYSGYPLALSLIILGLIFIISLSGKRKNGKILEEFI